MACFSSWEQWRSEKIFAFAFDFAHCEQSLTIVSAQGLSPAEISIKTPATWAKKIIVLVNALHHVCKTFTTRLWKQQQRRGRQPKRKGRGSPTYNRPICASGQVDFQLTCPNGQVELLDTRIVVAKMNDVIWASLFSSEQVNILWRFGGPKRKFPPTPLPDPGLTLLWTVIFFRNQHFG